MLRINKNVFHFIIVDNKTVVIDKYLLQFYKDYFILILAISYLIYHRI